MSWEDAAQALAALGHTVSVVNPARVKAYAYSNGVRTNTDAVDARVWADFCRQQCPPAWVPAPAAQRALRALVARPQALIEMHPQENPRLDPPPSAVRERVEAHLAWRAKEWKQIQKALAETIDDDPELRAQRDRLDSIPGLGERRISTWRAYCAAPARFTPARQGAACAGLSPQQHQSGSSVRGTPRRSKIGHAFLRRALYMPALVTLYKADGGKRFRQALRPTGSRRN